MERVKVSEVAVESPERFSKKVCFSNPQVQVFVLTFLPGQGVPAHKHPGSTLVIHVAAGAGVVGTDGTETPVSQGDILFVDAEEKFSAQNTGDQTLVMVCSLSPSPGAKAAPKA